MNNTFTYRLSAELLASLEAEGYPLGTGKHLQVQELLHQLSPNSDAEALRLALCPLFARTPQEQAHVYELFDECRKRVEAIVPEASAFAAGAVPNVAVKEVKKRRLGIIIMAAPLILAIVIGAYYYFWGVPKPTETVQDIIENLPKKDSDSVDQNLQPETRNPQTLFQPKPYPYDHDLAKYAITPPPAWQEWLIAHWWWLHWALFALFTSLLFAIWRYLEYKRRKLIAERGHNDLPPYFWNIRIENGAEISTGDSLTYVLQAMRRRSGTDTYAIDLPRTIHATAERGGLPDFRFREQTQPVEYLLLIDRQNVQNHRARLFDSLYHAFREQEIEMARFFYDSDMRVYFNEEHPHGIGLQDLQQHFSQARLLVVGTGTQLISSFTGKLQPWASLFSAWKQRALFTPKSLSEWGRPERRLPEIFTILPATLQGLGFWIESLEDGQDARFEEWRTGVKDAPQLPIHPDDHAPVPLLQVYYDAPKLQWIASCAIYPSLHWDLTIWLGRQIATMGQPKLDEDLVSIENVLLLSRLSWFVEGEIPPPARAALLEWMEREHPELLLHLRAELALLLRHNPPPQGSASFDDYQMIISVNEWLGTPDRHRRKELEKEITQMLANGAEVDFTVLKYLDRPRTALDFVVPDTWKKYVYPSGYRGLGWYGKWRDLRWAAAVWLLVVVLLLWPWEMKLYECEGEKVQYMVKNEALTLCLDLPEKKVVYFEWLVRDAILKGNLKLADSLLIERSKPFIRSEIQNSPKDVVEELGPPPDIDPNNPPPPPPSPNLSPVALSEKSDSITKQIYIEGDKNIATALFNRALIYNEGWYRDSACYYFHSAVNFDSVDLNIARGVAWCGSTLILPDSISKSGLEMVWVKGGTYIMGSAKGKDDECPHSVTVRDFRIGKYEVTQSDWQKVMGNTPSFKNNCLDCPVDDVSWNDVQSFLKKLNALTGKQYRLPTEEEWEFAARGGIKSKGYTYAGGNNPQDVGWYDKVSNRMRHSVGLKKPNELGIYDMSGNVWEWCQNESQPYPGCKVDKCDGCRVLRGGSWYFGFVNTTVANRDRYYPDRRSIDYGFRLATGTSSSVENQTSQAPQPVDLRTVKPKPLADTLWRIGKPSLIKPAEIRSKPVVLIKPESNAKDSSGISKITPNFSIGGAWVTDEAKTSGWKLVFLSGGVCRSGFFEGTWHMTTSKWHLSGNKLTIDKSSLSNGPLEGVVEWVDRDHIFIIANWGPDSKRIGQPFTRLMD